VRREHEHPRAGAARRETAGRLDTVHNGHTDVHEHDVGAQCQYPLDGLHAIGRLADDLDVWLGAQDHREPGPDQRLVVGDHRREPGGPAARHPRGDAVPAVWVGAEISQPLGAIIAIVLFAAGLLWLRLRGGRGPAVYLGVLFALEIVGNFTIFDVLGDLRH